MNTTPSTKHHLLLRLSLAFLCSVLAIGNVFLTGSQLVYAASGSVTDSYTDTSKINTGLSSNYVVSGGQLTIQLPYPNGQSCTLGSDCASGFCADSVCCNTACTGSTCQRCDSYSNAGAGTCGYISTQVDPDNECAPSYNACSGNNKIGPDGNCSGTGLSCKTDGQSSACATASTCQTGGGCSGGSCVAVGNTAYGSTGTNCTSTHYVCNGSGACIVPTYNQCFAGNSCCDPGRPYYTCYYGPTYLGYPRANNAGCIDSYSGGGCGGSSMGCGNGIYPASVMCSTYSY